MKDGYDREWFIGPNVSRRKVMLAAHREAERGVSPFVHAHPTDESCTDDCLGIKAQQQEGESDE